MGIDIYLGGFAAYKKRTRKERREFETAVKMRDSLPTGSTEANAAQELVVEAFEKMISAEKGYIRSSYNSTGLFRVLEEVFGFDVAAYLFPGDWSKEMRINGAEFVGKVESLQKTAVLALLRNNFTLPWINEFTEVTGERAPDPNQQRARAEAFGDTVFKAISQALGTDAEMSEPSHELGPQHGWYLTQGLVELRSFGLLARSLSDSDVLVEISY